MRADEDAFPLFLGTLCGRCFLVMLFFEALSTLHSSLPTLLYILRSFRLFPLLFCLSSLAMLAYFDLACRVTSGQWRCITAAQKLRNLRVCNERREHAGLRGRPNDRARLRNYVTVYFFNGENERCIKRSDARWSMISLRLYSKSLMLHEFIINIICICFNPVIYHAWFCFLSHVMLFTISASYIASSYIGCVLIYN